MLTVRPWCILIGRVFFCIAAAAIAQKLLTLCLSLDEFPAIRYKAGTRSEVSNRVASILTEEIGKLEKASPPHLVKFWRQQTLKLVPAPRVPPHSKMVPHRVPIAKPRLTKETMRWAVRPHHVTRCPLVPLVPQAGTKPLPPEAREPLLRRIPDSLYLLERVSGL